MKQGLVPTGRVEKEALSVVATKMVQGHLSSNPNRHEAQGVLEDWGLITTGQVEEGLSLVFAISHVTALASRCLLSSRPLPISPSFISLPYFVLDLITFSFYHCYGVRGGSHKQI